MIHIGHFMSNQVWSGTSERSSEIRNPATGAVTGHVTLANRADVDQVIKSARRALPGWASTPPAKRAAVMFNFRDLLVKNLDALAALLSAEHGKTIADAKGEIARGIEVVEYAAGIWAHVMYWTEAVSAWSRVSMTFTKSARLLWWR